MATNPRLPASLEAWLAYLEQLHPQGIALGLERVEQVASRLQLQQPAPRVVLVAGTNGKGTSCAALEQLLLAAGKRVAVYGSPHLQDYNERLRINGQQLDDAAHCRAFAAIEAVRGDTQLTYFEFGTLAALWLIKEAKVEFAVIEVGLGGRLDATNIVNPEIAVITTVDIDHQQFLGSDREGIGHEKAGILRHNGQAVIGDSQPPQSLRTAVAALHVDADWAGHAFAVIDEGTSWRWRSADGDSVALPKPSIPLVNCALALQVMQRLGVTLSDEQLITVVGQIKLAGRMQQLGQSPLRLVDVAHNPQAAHYLASQLRAQKPSGGRVLAVFGVMADKEVEAIIAPLLPVVDSWYLVAPRIARALPVLQLQQHFCGQAVSMATTVAEGWEQALAATGTDDLLIGFGSFYTVAEILQAERGDCGIQTHQ